MIIKRQNENPTALKGLRSVRSAINLFSSPLVWYSLVLPEDTFAAEEILIYKNIFRAPVESV
jgi:hypothetical protein